MTTLIATVTENDVFIALRTYLLSILDPAVWEVMQGQENRVAEPIGVNFIVMTPMSRPRLSTNIDTWDRTGDDPSAKMIETDLQFDMQLDIHGPGGSDAATVIAATIFDEYARYELKETLIAPLYATDGNQIPFVNGEGQYENRWVMTVALQIRPAVSTPMEFAATLTAIVNPIIGGP